MKECVIVYRRSLTHQEIKDAEAEELEDEAHVAEVVEPVVHDAAKAEKDSLKRNHEWLSWPFFLLDVAGIGLLDLLQHVHFQFCRFSILVHILDDLQRDDLVPENEILDNWPIIAGFFFVT